MNIQSTGKGYHPIYLIIKNNQVIGYIYKHEKKIQLDISITFEDFEYINKYMNQYLRE